MILYASLLSIVVVLFIFFVFFFFSSRRRHTRCSRDWSSDVCSSDLPSRLQNQSVDNFQRLLDCTDLERIVPLYHRKYSHGAQPDNPFRTAAAILHKIAGRVSLRVAVRSRLTLPTQSVSRCAQILLWLY